MKKLYDMLDIAREVDALLTGEDLDYWAEDMVMQFNMSEAVVDGKMTVAEVVEKVKGRCL